MTVKKYLTVRCAVCECWLHPMALSAHAQPGRCRGHLWSDEVGEWALVADPAAEVVARVLPAALVSRPRLDGVTEHHGDVGRAITVRSPLVGVSPQVWAHVAALAARAYGEGGVVQALSPAGFEGLRRELAADAVTCAVCGQVVAAKSVNVHRGSNGLCRWLRAVAAVREKWDDEWRDPWSVPGAPLRWTDLTARKAWRDRLDPVVFPRWTAVLLSPPKEPPRHDRKAVESPAAARAM